tara:strand:- start:441 stop:542 length:102 start_codon:yes stop_codon:yes gene_type:complete
MKDSLAKRLWVTIHKKKNIFIYNKNQVSWKEHI